MARETLIDQIIRDRTGRTIAGTVSVAVEKLAEEFAREAMADDALRKSFRDLVHRESVKFLKRLHREDQPRRRRSSRRKSRTS